MSNLNGSESNIDKIRRVLLSPELSGVTLQELEAAAIQNAMNLCDGDLSRAAEILGVSIESLSRKLG